MEFKPKFAGSSSSLAKSSPVLLVIYSTQLISMHSSPFCRFLINHHQNISKHIKTTSIYHQFYWLLALTNPSPYHQTTPKKPWVRIGSIPLGCLEVGIINGTSTIDDFPSYKPHFASGITQLGLMTQDTVYPEKDPNIIPFLSPLNPY